MFVLKFGIELLSLIIYIRFIGTHEEYNKIDCLIV